MEWCQNYLILFITFHMITTTFWSSPWWPPAVVTAAILRYNHTSDNPVDTLFLCCDKVSDIMGGTLLCKPLLYGRRWWIHQILFLHSSELDTVENLPPNVTDLVLTSIYYRWPHCNAYIIPRVPNSLFLSTTIPYLNVTIVTPLLLQMYASVYILLIIQSS